MKKGGDCNHTQWLNFFMPTIYEKQTCLRFKHLQGSNYKLTQMKCICVQWLADLYLGA